MPFRFECSAVRPALYSFPTRRSSDLVLVSARQLSLADEAGVVRLHPEGKVSRDPAAVRPHRGWIATYLSFWVQAYNTSREDRKSTRLNSSHLGISYAVFCLKKKKITH